MRVFSKLRQINLMWTGAGGRAFIMLNRLVTGNVKLLKYLRIL